MGRRGVMKVVELLVDLEVCGVVFLVEGDWIWFWVLKGVLLVDDWM